MSALFSRCEEAEEYADEPNPDTDEKYLDDAEEVGDGGVGDGGVMTMDMEEMPPLPLAFWKKTASCLEARRRSCLLNGSGSFFFFFLCLFFFLSLSSSS